MLSRGGFELNEIWRKQAQLVERDEDLRTLERRHKATGSPGDRARYARALLRSGESRAAARLLGPDHHSLSADDHHTYTHALGDLAKSLPDPHDDDHKGHDHVFDTLHPHFHHLTDEGRTKLSKSALHIAKRLDAEHHQNSQAQGGRHPGSGHLSQDKFHRLSDALSSLSMGHKRGAQGEEQHTSDAAKFLRTSRTVGHRTRPGESGTLDRIRYNSSRGHQLHFRAHQMGSGTGRLEVDHRRTTGDEFRDVNPPYHRPASRGPAQRTRIWRESQTIDVAHDQYHRSGDQHRKMSEGPAEILSDYHDHDAPHDRAGGRLRRHQANWHEGGGFSKHYKKHEYDGEGNLTSTKSE